LNLGPLTKSLLGEHTSNEETKISVKTPFGNTKREDFKNIDQQGGSWGGLLCSNSMCAVEKRSKSSTNYSDYLYKGLLEVPLLSYIDDMNKISKCGLNTLENNVILTKQTEMKRLNFNVGNENKKSKCHRLHVGRARNECINLTVRNKDISNVHETKYLGDLVSGSAKNMNNIIDRVAKGKGIINEIFNILDILSFGPHYFKIAFLLRETMMINSVAYNADIWYNLHPKEIHELNKVDKYFFSRLFHVPGTTSFCSFFLEGGLLTLEMVIKYRRIMYYHSLVRRRKNQAVYVFFMTQFYKKTQSDWITQTLLDFSDLMLDSSFEYLENISKFSFKKIVKLKVKQFAFNKLLNEKQTYSKLRKLKYKDFKMQSYLEDSETTIEEKITTFKWRTSMEQCFGENFRGSKGTVRCPQCMTHSDSQKESFYNCNFIRNQVELTGNYELIYEDNIKHTLVKTISRISKLKMS
jgi:hypothetical protein